MTDKIKEQIIKLFSSNGIYVCSIKGDVRTQVKITILYPKELRILRVINMITEVKTWIGYDAYYLTNIDEFGDRLSNTVVLYNKTTD